MGVYQLGPATHLSPSDVASLWVQAGGDPGKAPVAVGIVFGAENPAGNAGLVNDTPETGDYSVGLWQINYYGGLLETRSAQFGSPEALAADPLAQARAAVAMSQNGQNFAPWGPDLGYSGYGQAVTDPRPGSKVANWLAAHPVGVTPAWVLPVVAVGIVGVSGAVAAWMLASGGRLETPRLPRFAFEDNPLSEARLTYGQRKHLPDSAFALPELRRDGKGGLPLTDARGQLDPRHVANAAARLAQMKKRGTVTPEQWRRARRKIIRAACAVGVEQTCQSELAAAAEDADRAPTYVQSLLFPLSRYSVPEAKQWARAHGYLTGQVDVGPEYIHLTQFKSGYRGMHVVGTVPFGRGIKAHVAREAAA